MVACRGNGKETAMRLIKDFSSECEDDWKKESGVLRYLGKQSTLTSSPTAGTVKVVVREQMS